MWCILSWKWPHDLHNLNNIRKGEPKARHITQLDRRSIHAIFLFNQHHFYIVFICGRIKVTLYIKSHSCGTYSMLRKTYIIILYHSMHHSAMYEHLSKVKLCQCCIRYTLPSSTFMCSIAIIVEVCLQHINTCITV